MLCDRWMGRRGMLAAGLVAAMLAGGIAVCGAAEIEQSQGDVGSKRPDIVPRVTLSYRNEPLGRVLDYVSRASRGVNVKVSAETPEKAEEVRAERVTVELTNVTWKTAVQYIAKQYGFLVDDTMEESGVVILERPPHVSMTVKDAKLTYVIQLIAAQANVNIITGKEVEAIDKVNLNLYDVPWRAALDGILKTYGLVKVEESSGIIRISSPASEQVQHEIRAVPLKYMQPFGTKYRAALPSNPYVTVNSGGSEDGGNVGSLLGVLNQIKSPDGSVSYERRTNMLVIKDAPTVIERMMTIIKQLDREPMQVKINVRILSYKETGNESTGVNWTNGLTASIEKGVTYSTAFPFSVDDSDGSDTFDFGYLSAATKTTEGPASISDAVSKGLTGTADDISEDYTLGTISFASLQAILQLVRNNTNVKVLQSPEIVALDNQEATIHIGKVVRYAQFYTENMDGTLVSGYKEVTPSIIAGVQLIVIPHICGADDKIIMEIVPQTEDFNDEWEVFGEGTANELRLPKTSTKSVVTKMKLGNRETGVIAGLMNDSITKAVNKVPLLGDIPGLRWAFRNETMSRTKENVLIFVTPTILTPHHNEDFKEELESVRDMAAGITPVAEDQGNFASVAANAE